MKTNYQEYIIETLSDGNGYSSIGYINNEPVLASYSETSAENALLKCKMKIDADYNSLSMEGKVKFMQSEQYKSIK